MVINTSLNTTYYKSDSIEHGRLVKSFFTDLTNKVFNHSNEYYEEHLSLLGQNDFPLLYNETMLYSIIGSAIAGLTNIHLSEIPFSFSKKDKQSVEQSEVIKDSKRRVDFWCLYKNKDAAQSKALNYFIEVKHGWYCTSNGTDAKPAEHLMNRFNNLMEQMDSLKKDISPDWEGDGNVMLGLMVIPGYYTKNKSLEYKDEKPILDELYNRIDGRKGIQLIANTLQLPDNFLTQWDNKYNFVTIVGMALTVKK